MSALCRDLLLNRMAACVAEEFQMPELHLEGASSNFPRFSRLVFRCNLSCADSFSQWSLRTFNTFNTFTSLFIFT
jgi:hypothetical protein